MDTDPPIFEPPILAVPWPQLREAIPHGSPLPEAINDATNVAGSEFEIVPVTVEQPVVQSPRWKWWRWPSCIFETAWCTLCLCVLLAVVAAIPLVQLASLGYLMNSAANLAKRRPWSSVLPGYRRAGQIGLFLLLAGLFWLPVWLVTDLSYSAQLLQPGSSTAGWWRLGAFVVTLAWVTHVGWAAIRGGRAWHFIWPAPMRFFQEVIKARTWSLASEHLADLITSLHFPRLWWLGARAALGALLWTAIPVSLMIIGERAFELQFSGLVGFVGAVSMTFVALYLPFLQVQMAAANRFAAMFELTAIRRRFLYAPWAHALSLMVLCLLSIPLYLLRIEATPAELVWAPSLVFVCFMLPAKLLLGAAMGYASGRQSSDRPKIRHWLVRWPARVVALASVLVYVGALYLAQLVAGQGAYVMYFQHAFLVPAPLLGS